MSRTHYAALPPLPLPHAGDLAYGTAMYTREQLEEYGVMCLKTESAFEEFERSESYQEYLRGQDERQD